MAGVSKSTVSRVMNNSKPVSAEVKKRVLDAIATTNFKPSAVARSLANQKTKLVGVIIPDFSNPVFSDMINGIEKQAQIDGYNILLCNSRSKEESEITFLDILIEKEVDGLILSGFHTSNTLCKKLAEFSKPIVIVGYEDPSLPFPTVIIDNVQATKDVANYLIGLGHQHLAMIRGPLFDHYAGDLRYEGFQSVVKDHGLHWGSHTYEVGQYKTKDGYKAAMKLIQNYPEMTALFCANDEMAIGAIKALKEAGKKVPHEVSVVGFDDINIAHIYEPSLTTVQQPFVQKGEIAMTQLMRLMNGEETEKKVILPHRIVERDSTKRKS